MIGAFFYLVFHSWKNRMTMRIRRLKQPKYLMGALVGGLYFYFYFYRMLLSPRRMGGGFIIAGPQTAAWLEPLGALILFVVVFLGWVLPHGRAALVFTEAEVAFLFPAPVTRRTLVHFKLLKSQMRILFSVLFLTLVFGRFQKGGIAWIHALGWWVILSTVNLHLLGASFAMSRLLERGIATWKRRVVVFGLVAAVVIGVVVWAQRTIPPPDVANMKGASDVEYYLQHALGAGPAGYILYPFRIVVRPRLQPDVASFLQALWPALLLLGLHYLWVIRSDVAFEEASVEASKKMAERLATMRANRGQLGRSKPTKKKRAPFKLHPEGLAAVGLFWKNLIGAGQAFTLRFWLMLVMIAVFGGMGAAGAKGGSSAWLAVIGPIALVFLMMSFLIGPQIVRQDFRHDLPMADLLKTYPLRGWEIALGELLAPVAILTGAQWVLIILCVLTSASFAGQTMGTGLRLGIASGLTMLAPGLNFVTLIIPNAAVLLFPSWFQTGKDGPQGIEATGQRLIFMLGQLLVFVVALLPAALVLAGVIFGARLAFGVAVVMPIVVPIAAAGAAVVLGAEAWMGVLWLGRLFEKFDVASEGAGQG